MRKLMNESKECLPTWPYCCISPVTSDNTHQPVSRQHKQPRFMEPNVPHRHFHVSDVCNKHVGSRWSSYCPYFGERKSPSPVTRTLHKVTFWAPTFIHTFRQHDNIWNASLAGRYELHKYNSFHFIYFSLSSFCHLVSETWVHYWEPVQSGTRPDSAVLTWTGSEPDKQKDCCLS